MRLTDDQLDALRARHRELAEVVDSDRTLECERQSGVIAMRTIQLRRERIRAAEARWGHQLHGDRGGLA